MNEYLKHFALNGDIVSVKPLGNGLINKTYVVETTVERYVFQFINDVVFPDVDMLMRNIEMVTDHLKEKGALTLDIVKTLSGGLYLKTEDGRYLRGYKFIEDSFCFEALPDLETVEAAAKGFGLFHRDLADFDGNRLGEVIPGFHDTKKRYRDFLAILNSDPKGRAKLCPDEIAFLQGHEGEYGKIVDALKEGKIHNCVTHNDPKINNVAFCKGSKEIKCILDLDTVMGGSFLYDVGDGLRSLFTKDNEDNKDTSLLKVDFPVYEAYLKGYLSVMGETVNPLELELIPEAVAIITCELAMRFLGDYIAGDVYFHTDYPEHNLVRARTQIALAKDLFAHLDELKAITKRIAHNG